MRTIRILNALFLILAATAAVQGGEKQKEGTAEELFQNGETQLKKAFEILSRDPVYSRDGANAKIPAAALKVFKEAEKDLEAAAKKAPDEGLKCSALYRLGESAYNQKDFNLAVERFKAIEHSMPRCYLVPESLLGMANAYLAISAYGPAEEALSSLSQRFPRYQENSSVAFGLGITALRRGDYAQAEKMLSPLDTPESRFYLAKTHMGLKKPLLAATLLNRVNKENPGTELREASSFFLGDSFFLSGDYDGAITKYEEFLRTFPFSNFKSAALYRIGSSRFQKKEYGQSRLSFGAMISQFPSDFYVPLAQHFIGESYQVNGQMRDALFAYSRIVSQHPSSTIFPMALYRLAWMQYEVGDRAQSSQTCDLFLNQFAQHPLAANVYLLKGNALSKLNRHAEALSAYQRILDIAPGTEPAEQALFLMFKTRYEQKEYGSILTSYQFLFKQLVPSQSKWRSLAHLLAAESYLAANQPEEALKTYETILKMYPTHASAYYAQDGLAWSCQMLGRHEEALEARAKLTEMLKEKEAPPDAGTLNDLGMADSYFHKKFYTEAYQLYEKFIKENPDSKAAIAALYRAGLSLYHLRYYTQAVDTWRQLMQKAPESPEAQSAAFQAADTLFRGGRYPEAASAYKHILQRYPNHEQVPLAILRSAQAAFQMKDDKETLKLCQQLLTGHPKAGETIDALELSEAVFDRNRAEDFKEFFRAVTLAAPGTAAAGDAQFRLARRLFEQKDYVSAAEEFQRFSVHYTEHPSLPKAQLLLGESHFNQGKHQEAAAAFDRYTINYPKESDAALALLRLGSAYFSLKDFKKAAAAYEQLASQHAGSEYAKAAQFNLALSLRSAGELESAEAAYQKYASEAKNAEEALGVLWETFAVQKERKDYKSAIATLEKIQAAGTGETLSEAAYHKGEMHILAGEKEKAREAWMGTISLKPASNAFRLQSLIKLADIYEREADWVRAIAIYDDLSKNGNTADLVQAAKIRLQELRNSSNTASSGTYKGGK